MRSSSMMHNGCNSGFGYLVKCSAVLCLSFQTHVVKDAPLQLSRYIARRPPTPPGFPPFILTGGFTTAVYNAFLSCFSLPTFSLSSFCTLRRSSHCSRHCGSEDSALPRTGEWIGIDNRRVEGDGDGGADEVSDT